MTCATCEETQRRLRDAFVEGRILEALAIAGKGAADLARHVVTGAPPKGGDDEQPRPDA